MGSRVVKMFVSQFLNTGILILIVNAKIGDTPIANFLSGKYDDLNVNWYSGVGPTLVYMNDFHIYFYLFLLSS